MATGSSSSSLTPLFYTMSLFSHLREYRTIQSLAQKLPMYCVFGDTVLRSIVQTRPRSRAELLAIRGLSDEKCDSYGDDIIRIVKNNQNQPPASSGAAHTLKSSSSATVVVVNHGTTARRGGRRVSQVQRRPFDFSVINTATRRTPPVPTGRDGVYILELAHGRVYVGHSSDTRRRIQQHLTGQGSAFTKAFPPTGVVLPRLGCVTGCAEAAERDETLRYMFLRGIMLVRGWKYVRVAMQDSEHDEAEANIRELFDLCRRCGHPGHFIGHCKANFDRLGRHCSNK